METALSLAEKNPQGQPSPAQGGPSPNKGLDNILRLALNGAGQRPVSRERTRPMPDFDQAVDLLNRASDTMDGLKTRCDQLEENAQVEAERFAAELGAARAHAAEWERRATAIKAQLYDSEGRVSDLQLRVAALTQRAEQAEARAAEAEQQALETSEQAMRYHEKIITLFGSRT